MPGIHASPLLHGISGSGGPWDEVLMLGMIGGLLAVLLGMSFLSARRKKSRAGRSGKRPRPR